MRFVVWNCNMALHQKLDLLLALRHDVAVNDCGALETLRPIARW